MGGNKLKLLVLTRTRYKIFLIKQDLPSNFHFIFKSFQIIPTFILIALPLNANINNGIYLYINISE